MSKVMLLAVTAGLLTFVACGPSAKEIEQKKQDSIAEADSIAAVAAEFKAAQEKAKNDSIAKAEAEQKAKAEAEETVKKDHKKKNK